MSITKYQIHQMVKQCAAGRLTIARGHLQAILHGYPGDYDAWAGLVTKRFAGDEAACRRWWGAMGAWCSDSVYRARGLGAMPPPEQFAKRYRAALEFSLADVQEIRF